MSQHTRRTFLKHTGLAAAAWAAHSTVVSASEDERLGLAVIGTGGMGMGHVRALSGRKDARVEYVCDVDRQRLGAAAQEVESQTGRAPRAVGDLRRVLDAAEVDAVFIATPDHWHTPAALLALEAGKHVYVEKPCCHNLREGRLLVEAARRTGKLVQVGTQSRSTAFVREAIERLHKGEIGEILVAKAWNSQRRSSIGKSQAADPPDHLDFDAWLGPAPEVPYRPNLLPGIWRWWYDFGCGDIGNDGVHDIDVACWGLNVTSHPTRVACLGGKYFFDDDQQFPDTQYAVCEYAPASGSSPARQLIFEQRTWSPYVQEGYENGAAFYGAEGQLIIGHTTGWKLYGPRNALVAEGSGQADLQAHHQNFVDAIRGRGALNADAVAGHLSAAIVHLANISARVGRTLQFDPENEKIVGDADAGELLTRRYRPGHWSVPEQV
jgi:predicted dehydrogenase